MTLEPSWFKPWPPTLDIDAWLEFKLGKKDPPVDTELVRYLFEENYSDMFRDPRPANERGYAGKAGILIEVCHEGCWFRLAFHLDLENWHARLLTCFSEDAVPKFIGKRALEYLFKR